MFKWEFGDTPSGAMSLMTEAELTLDTLRIPVGGAESGSKQVKKETDAVAAGLASRLSIISHLKVAFEGECVG